MEKISAWKNYDVRLELKESTRGLKGLQLLVFVDNELGFSSKKDSLDIREYKYQDLTLNKYYLPVFVDNIQTKIKWKNSKEKMRYINFCKNFKRKICIQLQEECVWLFGEYGESHKEYLNKENEKDSKIS